jgi:anionic cell wall polymer biosynthesis LytR-Cps2A-Psr (LCP) family protein
MNKEAKTDIQEGSNHMNGYEALWYCRIRKLDSDFYRTQRQRKVLSAVIGQLKTMEVSEILNILNEAFPYITTSLSQSEMKKIGMSALTYVGYDIFQQQIPADKTWSDGSVNGSYVIDFDIAGNKAILQDFVYGKAEKTEE